MLATELFKDMVSASCSIKEENWGIGMLTIGQPVPKLQEHLLVLTE